MKILLASPVKQTEEIFDLFFRSLQRLTIPEGVEVDKVFYFHNSPELVEYCKRNNHNSYYVLNNNVEYTIDNTTHIWKSDNIMAVIYMKNELIKLAQKGYDYIFFVDSDLILEKDTLERLLEANKDIISQTFWTKWTPEAVPLPNSWDCDGYNFEEYRKYLGNEIIKIGMTGACTLIKIDVFKDKNIDFSPINNLRICGEDRTFCIRAAVYGYELFTDLRKPAFHIYRPNQIEEAKEFFNKTNN